MPTNARVLFIVLFALFACRGPRAVGQAADEEPNSAPARPPQSAALPADPLEGWLAHLESTLPHEPAKFDAAAVERVGKSADAIDQWAAQIAAFRDARTSERIVRESRRLLAAKQRIDRLLDKTLALRGGFATIKDADSQRVAVRSYLRCVAGLIDLSGRLRYLSRDALSSASTRLAGAGTARQQLLDVLIEHRSSIGAHVMAPDLTDRGPRPTSDAAKLKILTLIEITGQNELVGEIARLLDSSRLSAELVIAAAETIRGVGLPQAPRAATAEKLPAPAITAARLRQRLARVDAARLGDDVKRRHAELLAWLTATEKEGVTGESYRVGTFDVRPGDWLLMRNPSPYNLFTDLSPGLFTHVGVVALEKGPDGLRRMVLVDLPERGTRLPATNVEAFLPRTLHYVFLRHPDPAVARALADAAGQLIGNECQFDLNFRTDRVQALAHTPLAGQKIHTYCAGLLLVCALQTSAPHEEFFPLAERPAGGKTVANLAKLGLSVGEDFVSPTGALFSPRLEIVGRREPMYDPRREVEEAIFDHFAASLDQKTLAPSQNWYQSLRQKLAEASRQNPALAQALASAAGVNANMDLVAAAKTAAVVETLDEIAFGRSREFLAARDALWAEPIDPLPPRLRRQGDLAGVRQYQQRHGTLYDRLQSGRLTPRQLRQALVEYYVRSGQREIDRRFFAGP